MKRLLKSRLSALALPCAALLCAVLLCAVLVAGCGSSGRRVDPYGALQTPGPPPAARSGAQVWAVGMPVLVVASADGGATWRTAGASTHGDPFTQILYAVAFADSRHGWAVGKAGLVVAGRRATPVATRCAPSPLPTLVTAGRWAAPASWRRPTAAPTGACSARSRACTASAP